MILRKEKIFLIIAILMISLLIIKISINKENESIFITTNMIIEIISNEKMENYKETKYDENTIKTSNTINDSCTTIENPIEDNNVIEDTISDINTTEVHTESVELYNKENVLNTETQIEVENESDESKNNDNEDSNLTVFEVTFYTSLKEENEYTNITASGEKLSDKMLLASNVYPFGTIIYLEGYGELEVKDRGGNEFNSSNRLDIYIPKQKGENYSDYKKRVLSYGRTYINGKIIK